VSPCVEYVRFQENSLLDRALLSLSLRSPFTGAQGRARVCVEYPPLPGPQRHTRNDGRCSKRKRGLHRSPPVASHEAIRLSGGSVGSASIRTLAYLRGRGSTFWRWRRHLAPSGTVGLDKPRQAARSPNARRAVAPLAAPWPAVFQHDYQHGVSKAYCVVCGVCIWVCGVSARARCVTRTP
jgi:NAD-dependent dihydropyrimidine dehydrogenase PreA subunit